MYVAYIYKYLLILSRNRKCHWKWGRCTYDRVKSKMTASTPIPGWVRLEMINGTENPMIQATRFQRLRKSRGTAHAIRSNGLDSPGMNKFFLRLDFLSVYAAGRSTRNLFPYNRSGRPWSWATSWTVVASHQSWIKSIHRYPDYNRGIQVSLKDYQSSRSLWPHLCTSK